MTGTLTIDTVEIDAIGGPTMALHYAGFRFLTDPTYDAADGRIRITAVPALHGPEFAADFLADVTGFVLEADGHPTMYVSGDNASLTLVEQIAARFPAISIAVLFTGGARIAPVADNNLLTLDSALAARAAALMPNATIVPTHYEGWSHFTEGADDLVARFREAGLADRLSFA